MHPVEYRTGLAGIAVVVANTAGIDTGAWLGLDPAPRTLPLALNQFISEEGTQYNLIMAACCLALFLAPYTMWRKLKQGVYGEESLRIQIPAEPQE